MIWRTGKHHETAGRVSAELVDNVARFNDIALRLGHLFDAAEHHGLAVFLGDRSNGTGFVVELNLHFVRVVPTAVTIGHIPVVTLGHQHALSEEVLKRFVVLHETEVAHHLCPETGIKEVQHSVFDAADVLIHRHPVVGALVDHCCRAVGRAVTLEIPGGIDERVHRVGFTFGVRAALRALDVLPGIALRKRIA